MDFSNRSATALLKKQLSPLRIGVDLLAPLVAVVWLRLFAVVFHIPNAGVLELTLGLSVWLIYAFDRYLDFLSTQKFEIEPTVRTIHYATQIIFVFIFALDVYLAIRFIAPFILWASVPLFSLTFLYFLRVHHPSWRNISRWPREIVVGVLFALGICLPVAAMLPHPERILERFPLLALSMVLNCCGVKIWAAPGAASRHWLTFWIGKHMDFLGITLATGSLFLWSIQRGPILLAISASAISLAFLPRLGTRWRSEAWRAAADMVLCSPLLLPAFWR